MSKNLYKILKLNRSASVEEIKKSYRKLAKEYHPDLAQEGMTNSTEKFREVQHAYEILGDESKRRIYDRQLGTYGSEKAAQSAVDGSGLNHEPAYMRGVKNYRRTQAKESPTVQSHQFDEKVWRAWHYGEGNTVIKSSVTQKRNHAVDKTSPHRSYWDKRNSRSSKSDRVGNDQEVHRSGKSPGQKHMDDVAIRMEERRRRRRGEGSVQDEKSGDACIIA
jgi:DnaJ-class molecular chaperone